MPVELGLDLRDIHILHILSAAFHGRLFSAHEK